MQWGFDLLGRRVEVLGVTPLLRSWLEERFVFPQYIGILSSSYSITIHLRQTPPTAPEGQTAVPATVSVFPMHTLEGDQGCWIWDDSGGVHYRLEAQQAAIEVWGLERREMLLSGPVFAALATAIFEALMLSGLVPFHASVATQAGQATAFMGLSGTGKTTTLIRALQAGYQPVCEDAACLEPISGQVFGLDRGLGLLPDVLEVVRAWKPQVRPRPAVNGKSLMPYAALGFDPQPARLTRLVQLVRDPSRPSAWQPLTPLQATLSAWQATGIPVSRLARSHLAQVIPGLIERFTWKQLVLGQGDLPLNIT